jgi:uncharacterized protein YjeT (DUF2065 family)
METTVLIGKILSPFFLATGMGYLISGSFYRRLLSGENASSATAINNSAILHFFIGMFILANHFMWETYFQIIISLVGFAFLTRGLFLIILPELVSKTKETSTKILRMSGMGYLLLGLYVAYHSYVL